ncbi:MAG TPA: thioesterase [Prolixibacteraceae bacterium]|nr:thioesterase [Prolixibacteraceae bacterium]HPT30986.1 thioesterase [Prolixibacteraceae bacterium]
MHYKHHLRALSFHVDRTGEVSTPNLFWYMQEIAWEHAHHLGFGFEHLREDQLFWVLSRFYVKVDRRPRWTEKFDLETWSRGTDGFYGYRDFRFIDETGKEIITATSSWLVLDLSTKRIQRLGKDGNFAPYQPSILGKDAGKTESPQTSEELSYSPVLYGEIDINQHFNTGKYLDRINNSYSFDFHQQHILREMEVNFLKEGLPHDLLAVKKQELTPLDHLCSIVRKGDSNDLIRARINWEEKPK